jgi:hypothetical protein
MRHRNVWAAGLALGLGVAGLAIGQEPARNGPGLLDRLLTPAASPARGDAKKSDTRHDEKPAPAGPRLSRVQALNDYLRRLEVCDRLRQMAELRGDEELRNRADVLEMRAKDVYVQRTNSVDEEMLERKLAPNGRNLTPLSASSGSSTNGPAFAEGRR